MKNKIATSYSNFPSIAGSTMYKTMKSPLRRKSIEIINNNNPKTNNLNNTSKHFYPKTLKNLIKKRPLSPESQSLSKAETDDTLFGLSEVKIIDDKIHKRNNNRQKVWQIKSWC